MKYLEAKVTFDHPDPSLAADLIAGVFFDFELQGVVIEDPGLEPPADDWAEDAVARPARHAVSGYLAHGRTAGAPLHGSWKQALGETHRRAGLARQLPRARRAELGRVLEGVLLAAASIGRRIVVKPSWRDSNRPPATSCWTSTPAWPSAPAPTRPPSLCVELIEDAPRARRKPSWTSAPAPGSSCWRRPSSGPAALAGATATSSPCASQPRTCGATGSRRERCAWPRARSPALPRPLRPRGRQHPDPGHPGADRGHPARAEPPRRHLRLLRDHRGEPDLVLSRLKSAGFEIVDVRRREGWVAIAATKYRNSKIEIRNRTYKNAKEN